MKRPASSVDPAVIEMVTKAILRVFPDADRGGRPRLVDDYENGSVGAFFDAPSAAPRSDTNWAVSIVHKGKATEVSVFGDDDNTAEFPTLDEALIYARLKLSRGRV